VGSWREEILREFTPGVARLTLVADPDGLLTEEGVSAALRERGFEIIPFEDPLAFRFAYESKYRGRWDRGELTDLVVVLRSPSRDLDHLPFDLLQAGRKLRFCLGDLFPNLSLPVVEALDRSRLDVLHLAQTQHAPGMLGDNATKDFLLCHVYQLAPEVVSQPSDLLSLLLKKHYGEHRLPGVLDERLVFVLRQTGRFDDWPLSQIVSDRQAFYSFLQERWPVFVGYLVALEERQLGDSTAPAGLQFGGPAALPFGHDGARPYIGNLFTEGALRPIDHPQAEQLAGQWVAVGLRAGRERDPSKHLERLLESAGSSLPSGECPHQDWTAFAPRWAALTAAACSATAQGGQQRRFVELREEVDGQFSAWMSKRYHTLHNLPPFPPVMCHHLPRYLAPLVAAGRPATKVALVVLDGLAFDQWVTLREVLVRQRPELRYDESAVFAWVPTLTSVCRQAIFAGRAPLYFPSTFGSTNNDSAAWTQFWADAGRGANEVAYRRGVGESCLAEVEELLSSPKTQVVGLVVDKVDKIMHGMQLGSAGMHSQVRQWAEEGFLAKLLDLLHRYGFTVFLTSDHGNIEAIGCGSPKEGATAELLGLRARVYPEQVLRAEVRKEFPDALDWPACGLPEDYLALIASGRTAFKKEGTRVVAHGGACLEEVVVPFVRVIPTSP